MKSRFFRALVVCAGLCSLILHRGDSLGAASTGIIISQVYGGGGNAGSTFKNDFIELYNLGPTPVNLAGWSVQYASSSGTTWATTPLTGVLAPGAYYLVQEAQGAGGTVSLPTPNVTGSIAMSASTGKVALVSSTTPLVGTGCPFSAATVDFVGFGAANCSEGSGPAGTLSNTTAALRTNVTVDIDNNATAFTVGTPNPRNSPQNTAPSGVMTAAPSSAAAGATVVLTVAVTPGTNPPSTGITVKGDLQTIGGSAAQDFAQDPGDPNKFTFSATIGAGVTNGTKTVTAAIVDSLARSSTAQTTVAVTSPTDAAPAVTAANPANGTTNVPVDASLVIGFSESVTATATAFSIQCPAGSPQAFAQSTSPNSTFTLNPAADLPYATTCTVRVAAGEVTDTDSTDPPDTLTGDVSITFTTQNAPPPSNSVVVISQLYGGGGNTGATYQNDFVELYNRSSAVVNLSGWSLQYASATGEGWAGSLQPLGGTIDPGQYLLLSLGSGSNSAPLLPPANIYGQINLSGTTGKLALVNSFTPLSGLCPIGDPSVIDFVGFGGGASCGEGVTKAPSPSNTTALFRKGGGATDTDRNGSDFVTALPSPRRTAPIVELGPLVLSTDPAANRAAVARDATIEMTFTEPVNVVGPWFDITCASTGSHNDATFAGGGQKHYITPNVNFVAGEQCTVTLYKSQISDQDLDDTQPDTDTLPADHVWSFTVATGTAPPFPSSVHLALGNPSGAAADLDTPDNYLMEKPEFTLSYNRDLGRPNWVSWHLSDEWIGTLTRVDTFRADPAVPPAWYRVQEFDFTNSGFDRGHLVPNADRDKETSIPINQATFLMTNMVAQAPNNNQGPWATLENYLRTLLPANELYIVAGGAGAGGIGGNGGTTTTLAGGHVTVPSVTWKVALVLPKGENDLSRVSCTSRTIAVTMSNDNAIVRTAPWEGFLTTVDAVETLTGYNFFSDLPVPFQNCIEARRDGDPALDLVKGNQAITFPAPADHVYGDTPFAVSGSGGLSGNPVTFTASGACTAGGFNGATITVVSAGACTITASQAGSAAYDAAPDVERTFAVNRAVPSLSNLTVVTIEAGTATTVLGGNVGFGALAPAGNVTITLNGVSQTVAVGPAGAFSASFATASLAPSGTPYQAGYAYSGDTNFTPAAGAGSVKVVDTTLPSIGSVSVSRSVLSPPNHKMIDITVGYQVAEATAPVCSLSVSSNEPIDGSGDGHTSIDWQVIDAHRVQLRAERAGGGSGRIYTIAIRCTDTSGNTGSATTTVSVPK